MADQTHALPDPLLPGVWERIRDARWFQGKGRDGRLSRVLVLPPVVERDGLRVCHAVATVGYGDGAEEHYQLLLAHGPDGRGWRDAVGDPAALRCWAEALLAGRPASPDGSWNLERFAPAPRVTGEIRPFGGEQSNTTIEVGDAVMIKVFRRLEPGPNLDITTHAALNAAGVGSVARLFGALHGVLPLGPGAPLATDLAMIGERLPDPVDGWELITAAAASARGVGAQARAIGAALADIHRALARAFGTVRLDGDRIADQMTARLDRAVALAPALTEHRAALGALFDGLRGRELEAQRVHGDFHLGQTLSTPLGWRVIDFEGEPLKSAAERSAADSPWRDVAGMTRSLDYAAQSAPDPASAATRRWFEEARSAFLEGYGRADEKALRAYEADKAVYEMVYETLNRPGWVGIPLGAITAMCSGSAKMPDPDTAVRKDR